MANRFFVSVFCHSESDAADVMERAAELGMTDIEMTESDRLFRVRAKGDHDQIVPFMHIGNELKLKRQREAGNEG